MQTICKPTTAVLVVKLKHTLAITYLSKPYYSCYVQKCFFFVVLQLCMHQLSFDWKSYFLKASELPNMGYLYPRGYNWINGENGQLLPRPVVKPGLQKWPNLLKKTSNLSIYGFQSTIYCMMHFIIYLSCYVSYYLLSIWV